MVHSTLTDLPDQIRVIFDGGGTFKGENVNKNLLQGPYLQISLWEFSQDLDRQWALKCEVNKEYRDYLQFLWFQNGDLPQHIVTYRMNVQLFGAVSSLAYSNFGLCKTAQGGKSKFGETASFLQDNFQVNDGLKGVNTITEAIDIISCK